MALGMEVDLGPGHIVLDGDPAPLRQKGGRGPPIFGQFLLWPNGWMHQDASWYGCSLGPGHIVLDVDPAATPAPQIFGPCLLWSNDWMDQDATWYGGRPRPRRHCIRWGTACQFSAHVYCGKRLYASAYHLVWR